MKLIDPNIINIAEQKLTDIIAENIRWKSVREAIKKELNIAMMKDLTVDGGKLITRDEEIIYQVMLGSHTGISVFINRLGELVDIDYTENREAIKEILAKPDEEVVEEQTALKSALELSAEISKLIFKINSVKRAND